MLELGKQSGSVARGVRSIEISGIFLWLLYGLEATTNSKRTLPERAGFRTQHCRDGHVVRKYIDSISAEVEVLSKG